MIGVSGQSVTVSGLVDRLDSGNVGFGIKTIVLWIKCPNTQNQKILTIDDIDYVETNSFGAAVASGFPATTICIGGKYFAGCRLAHAVVDSARVSVSTFQTEKVGMTCDAFTIIDIQTYNRALLNHVVNRHG